MKIYLYSIFLLLNIHFSFCQAPPAMRNNSFNQGEKNVSYEKNEMDTNINVNIEKNQSNVKNIQNLEKSKFEVAHSEISQSSKTAQLVNLASQIINSNRSNSNQRSPDPQHQLQIEKLVDGLGQIYPNSFEYHFYKFMSGNYNIELINHLQKAEQLQPDNPEVWKQKVACFEILHKIDDELIYLDKLLKVGKLQTDFLWYAEDLLASVPENGILLTHGFEDTYSVLYLQYKRGLRKDVQIFSIDLMQSERYRENLLLKGFQLPEGSFIDKLYFKKFCELNISRKITISLTFPKEYLMEVQKNAYINGLVFDLRTDLNYNNFFMNDYLWNEILKMELIQLNNSAVSSRLSANYLPMLLILKSIYIERGEGDKLNRVNNQIHLIGKLTNLSQQLEKIENK